MVDGGEDKLFFIKSNKRKLILVGNNLDCEVKVERRN